MTRRIGLFLFVLALFLSVFTINAISVAAYLDGDSSVQPDIACDVDLGCKLSTGLTTDFEISNVVRMAQGGMTWSGLYLTESPIKTPPSNLTIGVYGCAVVAQAVIVSKFSGTTVFPNEVNAALPNSISFDVYDFRDAYPIDVKYITYYNISGKNFDQIYDILKPHLLLGRLLIVRSEIESGSSRGHYEVVYGFTERTDIYEYGSLRFETVKVRDSSGSNDLELRSFFFRYPFPKYLYVFEDKTK